jgi:hypothetical protein
MANLKDTFVLGKLTVTDSIIADKFKGPLEGNAATATKFNTSRTFSFAGDVSGTVTTDCASGFEVSLSVANNSHSHTYDNITNLDVPLNQWLASANAYTDGKISDLVNGAGADLDTLKELSAALNNDKDFAKNVLDLIATKIPLSGTNSTTGPITGGLTFSVVDAIKYKGTKNTYTMIKFIDNASDTYGNGIMIGGGGSVYIGSGESASAVYTNVSNSPNGGEEATHISSDGALNLYSNCNTINDKYTFTFDTDGSISMPGAKMFYNQTVKPNAANGLRNALCIYGQTYGNDATYIKNSGRLTYGDPGPQIIFGSNTALADAQKAALIFTDHDTIGAGCSLNLVSTESNTWFIAPTIKALTKFIGNLEGNADTATKATQDSDGLSIKDTYLKLSGGTITGGLTVNGSTLLKSTLTIGSSAQNVSPKVGIHVHDLRDLGRGQSGDDPAPWPGLFGDRSVNFYFDEINDSYGGGAAANRWMSIMHMKGWTGAYAAWELAGNAHSDSKQDTLRYRQGINNSWGAWQSVLTDANFTTYLNSTYVNVTGDTMTGTLTLTSPAGSSEGGQLVLAHTQNSNT